MVLNSFSPNVIQCMYIIFNILTTCISKLPDSPWLDLLTIFYLANMRKISYTHLSKSSLGFSVTRSRVQHMQKDATRTQWKDVLLLIRSCCPGLQKRLQQSGLLHHLQKWLCTRTTQLQNLTWFCEHTRNIWAARRYHGYATTTRSHHYSTQFTEIQAWHGCDRDRCSRWMKMELTGKGWGRRNEWIYRNHR